MSDQKEPTTVLEWLELARDAGFEWAEYAIGQRAKQKRTSPSLENAILRFAPWTSTDEGDDFWNTVGMFCRPITAEDLHRMADRRRATQPRQPRVCMAGFNHGENNIRNHPWGFAYPLTKDVQTDSESEFVPLIELTPEVRAALAVAGIDYERKEGKL